MTKPAAAKAKQKKQKIEPAPAIGARMDDKTVYVGVSPDTGEQLFTTPWDAAIGLDFNAAAACVKAINKQKYLGHDDWRLPTKEELNVLYNNADKGVLRGTFDQDPNCPDSWYISSTPGFDNSVSCQSFSGGTQATCSRSVKSRLRCVR